MCIIITKPAAIKIKKEYLEEAFRRNNDGGGVAIALGEKVLLIKPLWKFEHFYKVYLKFEAHPMLIHFRIKTHGSKCEDNTHPHPIAKHLAMAHNGVIHKATIVGDESDTRAFIRQHIQPIVKDHGHHAVVTTDKLKLYDGEIGSSKLAFINSLGHFSYVNKQMGHEHEGCWFSNYSYKKSVVTTNHNTNSNHHNAFRAVDYKLELTYCVGCSRGHQRRNMEGWWLSNAELNRIGCQKHGTAGITLHICHGCCKDHKIPVDSTHGWVETGRLVPDSLVEDVKHYIGILKREDIHANVSDGSAGSMMYGNEQCGCCGIKLHGRCQQPFIDPSNKARKITRHICRLCVGDLGFKEYFPDNVEEISEKSKTWKAVVAAEKWADEQYYKQHPRPAKLVSTVTFPEHIEKAKNLLAEPPVVVPTTTVIPKPPPTKACRVFAPGFACEMCGEPRLTIQHTTGKRVCMQCNEDYAESNFDWAAASKRVAMKLNMAGPAKNPLILPPIQRSEVLT